MAALAACVAVAGQSAPPAVGERAVRAERGSGIVDFVSIKHRARAPQARRFVLRIFTRGARDNSVWAAKGGLSVVARYYGPNNGFEEWRIKRTAPGEAGKLIRRLVARVRRKGVVKLAAGTHDLSFPKPSLVYQCRAPGFNELGACSI